MAERKTSSEPAVPERDGNAPSAGGTPAQVPTLTDTQVNAVLTEPLAAVVVVSQSKELITTLETALAASQPIFVPDFKGLSKVLAERAVGVVVLDADGNRKVQKASIKLKAAHPEIAIVVACPRVAAEPFMPLLSEGVVYRVLITPASPGQSRLLVSAALKAHAEMMRGRDPVTPGETPPPIAKLEPAGSGWPLGPKWIAAIGVGVLAVIAVAALLLSGGDPDSASPAAEPATVESAPAVEEPDATPVASSSDLEPAQTADQPAEETARPDPNSDVLAAAEAAYATGNWFGPDSAYEIWSQLLAENPANPGARAGLDALADAQISRLEQSLVLEQIDQAEALLDDFEASFPAHPRLGFLSLQLERERQRQVLAEQSLAEASQAVEDAARAEAVAERTELAAAQLEVGRLLEPAQDSAAALLAQARDLDASSPEVQRLTRALVAQLVQRFEAAIDAEDLAAATQWQAAVSGNGANGSQIEETQRQLDLLRRSQDDAYLTNLKERFADALEAGALLEPEGESARDHLDELRVLTPQDEGLTALQADFARALNDAVTEALATESWDSAQLWLGALRDAPGAEATADQAAQRLDRARRQAVLLAEVVPASVLTLMDYEPPGYPRAALARGQEGWVDLELTVNTAGLPENIVVSGSEPSGVFEAAALEATQAYRFEPYLEEGVPYARRVALKIRFALE